MNTSINSQSLQRKVSGGLNMLVYAVVPVKGLGTSKERLSTVLSPQERKELTLAMLEDVLTALQNSTITKIVVVSNDLVVRDVAGKFGASHISEKNHGLNSAIDEATEWCIQEGAEAVLVLPADIPLLSTADVNKIVELGSYNDPTVVLSCSGDGGTNALFQSPPNLIHAAFGPMSFEKHSKEANSKCLTLKLYQSRSVAMDIDSAQDLSKLLKSECTTACRQVLNQFKLNIA